MSRIESSWDKVQKFLSLNIKLNAYTEKHPPGHLPFPFPLHASSASGFGPGGGSICTSGFGLGVVIRGGGSKSVRTPSMISMHIKLLPHFQKKDKVRKKLCETMLDFSFKAPN